MYKESYFSPACLEAHVKRLARDLTGYERHPGPCEPFADGHSALLVLDMQRYFLDPGSHAFVPSAPEILPGILGLIDTFNHHSRPVLFTRHGNTTGDGGAMTRWWGGVLEKGSAHWLLDQGLSDHAPASQIIDKTQYDAFYGTDLEACLQKAAVRTLHICGVMTHLCCETTARAAFVRGYDVYLVADATATYHYDLHLGALRGLAHGFARISWISEYKIP